MLVERRAAAALAQGLQLTLQSAGQEGRPEPDRLKYVGNLRHTAKLNYLPNLM